MEDKANLISKYNCTGYRDARIIKDSISKNPDNTINIDIWVEEGVRILYPEYHLGGKYEIQRPVP